MPQLQPKLGDSRIRRECIEVESCGCFPLTALKGALRERRRRSEAVPAKQTSEASEPSRSAGWRLFEDLLSPDRDCRVVPPGALAGERVALGDQKRKLVPSGLKIAPGGLWGTGQFPFRRCDLLDNEFNLIAPSRMGFRSDFISVTFVIIAQVPNSVGVRPQ